MPATLAAISQWIAEPWSRYVCVTSVHGIMECQRDEQLREAHNASDLTVPDGVPLVWAGRYAGVANAGRVSGTDLVPALAERARDNGWRVFLYGGRPEVVQQLSGRLLQRYPDLRVVGAYSPPFRPLTPAEDRAVVDRINAASPDIVLVGLGTPKQERWMAAHVHALRHPVLIGVGAAFDFHAGTLRRAPRWLQRMGLEWLFRLAMELVRLGPRYLRNNPAFVASVIRRPPRRLA